MANTSIGTAWIQIKPTTTSLRTAVESGLNGSQIGSTFWKNFSAAGAGAIAGITSQLTQTVISTVRQNWSNAIERADVLTRFPKVMEMMGYSAEEASDTIAELRNRVMGLPTALNDVVAYTQRLAGSTGSLSKAADLSMAVSDAMLANGASAEAANRATEQFVQALLRGKPIGNDWNTVMEVAPTTMNRLAQSLGYASATIGGDFYTAWQKGELATEDLINQLIKLDKEGGESIQAFSQVAKTSVGGFKTSLTLIGQTIANIGAAYLTGQEDTVNASIDNLVSLITGSVPKLVSAFSKTVIAVARVIPKVAPEFADAILEMLPDLIDALVSLILAIAEKLPELLQIIVDKLPLLINALGKALQTLAESPALLEAGGIILAAIFGMKAFSGVANIIKGTLLKGLSGVLGSAQGESQSLFVKFFGAIGDAIQSLVEPLAKTIRTIMKELGNAILDFAKPLAKAIESLLTGLGKGIAGFFGAMANPEIIVGAGIFVVVAAAIAAAILAIGKAIEWAAPGLRVLMNDIIMPIANFLKDTLLAVLELVIDGIVRLTYAIEPLVRILADAFLKYVQIVADAIRDTLAVALEGLAKLIDSVGDAFLKMGEAVRTALSGVQGILQVFADMISSIAEGLVAIVALATHQSIVYGRGYATVTRAATGGLVDGIGTETSDSNLYALSKGEYVIRAAAARKIGYDNLDNLNDTGTMASGNNFNFTINGYDKSPDELANIISRKIALKTQGVLA